MENLNKGTPLFGEDFRTPWSFYTLFSNKDLANMIPTLRTAPEFQRILPENLPEEVRKQAATGLSERGHEFAANLIEWFSRIQTAEQDAFIMWW